MTGTEAIDVSLMASSRRKQRAAVLLWFWALIVTFIVSIGLGVVFSFRPDVRAWGQARTDPAAELSPAPLGVWLPVAVAVVFGLAFVVSGWIMSSPSHVGPGLWQARLPGAVFRGALVASSALGAAWHVLRIATKLDSNTVGFVSTTVSVVVSIFITIGLASHLGRLADYYDSASLRERLVRYLWLALLVTFFWTTLGTALARVSAGQPQPQDPSQPPTISPHTAALVFVWLVFGLAALVVQILLLMNLHRLAAALGEYVEPEPRAA